MKKFRIKEEIFNDGKSDFYPQISGKVLEQNPDPLNLKASLFIEVEKFITLTEGGLPVNSLKEALEIIEIYKHKNTAILISEKIHEIE